MKIRAHVISVASVGDGLQVVAEGSEVAAGDWPSLTPIRFCVRDIAVNRNTFRVGRDLAITVEAK